MLYQYSKEKKRKRFSWRKGRKVNDREKGQKKVKNIKRKKKNEEGDTINKKDESTILDTIIGIL